MPFQLRPCDLLILFFAVLTLQNASILAFSTTCCAVPVSYSEALQEFEFSQLPPFSSFPVEELILLLVRLASVAILQPLLCILRGILELSRSLCALEFQRHSTAYFLDFQYHLDTEQLQDRQVYVLGQN